MRPSRVLRFAPWAPGARGDVKRTVPPPPAFELGGLEGDAHLSYSSRLAETPHWRRMADTPYRKRMEENATRYPFTTTPGLDKKRYDVRFLPAPRTDPLTHRSLVGIGLPREVPVIDVPVIFLQTVHTEDGALLGNRFETRWVDPDLMRNRLHPSKLAVYATVEWYQRLGLPVRDHKIHQEIPINDEAYRRMRQKQLWEDEPWRYSTFMRFKAFRDGPPELMDDPTPWDGVEEVGAVSSGAGAADGSGGRRTGPKVQRKARKVKLF